MATVNCTNTTGRVTLTGTTVDTVNMNARGSLLTTFNASRTFVPDSVNVSEIARPP